MARLALLPFLAWSAAASQTPAALVPWARVLTQPAAWYASPDAARIADAVRLYQRETGGWPKNIDMAKPLSAAERTTIAGEKGAADATIDNGATVTQIRYLTRVYAATRHDQDRDAALAAIDYLLRAQYPNGGWPQYFPLRKGYWSHITFNDGAMVNVMTLLNEIATRQPLLTVAADATRAARVEDALGRAVALTLRLQIRVAGRLTGWCQQYDEATLEPAGARAYEHPSIASSETVGIVRFLMGLAAPPDQRAAIAVAIDGAAEWLKRSEIHGVRLDRRPDPSGPQGYDVVVVPDSAAPPLWARFYDITANTPMFSGRDGVIRRALADIEIERRAGYSWLGTYAASLLAADYPAWITRGRQ